MELKEFIKHTLLEVTNGVIDAQNELNGTGCLINPSSATRDGEIIKNGIKNDYRSIQKIKMNIAVSVSENSGLNSNLGVVNIIKAGFNTDESVSNEKITTIEFEIPIAFPVMNS
jgi:hypothetical protein